MAQVGCFVYRFTLLGLYCMEHTAFPKEYEIADQDIIQLLPKSEFYHRFHNNRYKSVLR